MGRTRVGKGIFAQKHYREHDIIGEIKGTIIADPDYGSEYCFRVGDDACLEPDPPFRFVNHSCEPNCEFDWFAHQTDDDGGIETRVYLIALQHIKPGDELVIAYNWSAESAIPCRCGSPNCCGWVVDPEDLSKIQDIERVREAAPVREGPVSQVAATAE
ncbi:MAG: SET domain-containing protein-lysine N-methyltransferase [Planctomycetes bacterium]|nr:SET domain-containing protein-lysine N-methyltransferase [Planctomycetota bacterium]